MPLEQFPDISGGREYVTRPDTTSRPCLHFRQPSEQRSGILGAEDAQQVLEAAYFLMVAMWPAAHPAPAVRVALKRPELRAACVDFEARFTELLSTSILGLRVKRSG